MSVIQYRLNQVTASGFNFLSNSWNGLGLPGNFLPMGVYLIQYLISTWDEGYVAGVVQVSVGAIDIPVIITAIRFSSPVIRRKNTEFYALLEISSCYESAGGGEPSLQFLWQIMDSEGFCLSNSTLKRMILPQYFFGTAATHSYTVSLTCNLVVARITCCSD
jgi:hypothetical protein